ncbi:MAG: adenosylcobalamin-dependent ribonucleoside-diphosphate reductase, partial [Candidatus Altiarchaeota archaeon]
GTGFSFTRLRPKGDVVKSTGGIASGPISFMKVFNASTEVIKQGGTRRGANMGILRVDHPDIIEFITAKEKLTELNNFNISVGLTEEFMKAVVDDRDYDLRNPRDGKSVKKISAKFVFELIVSQSWKTGEPGIIFLDRINRDNPTPALGEIESTNPCGEQPLLPYEACNLGSINLSKMVSDGKINWDKLKKTVHTTIHFLDNVIDRSKYPLPEIDEMVKSNRKVGLGVMGWADMIIQLSVPYNTDEAVALGEKVMKFVTDEARAKSEELGKKRGSFPNFPKSVFGKKRKHMRNATVTTIAPTGTISIISSCSSGIEPLFAVSYVRNVMDGTELLEVNPLFKDVAKKRGFYSENLMMRIAREGSIQHIDEIPDDVKKVFVTAHEITPEWHVRMQAAFQKHTDNAVSKTVNFPSDATTEEVEEVFLLAYTLGCKGVTIYRDKSREEQVLNIGSVNREGDKKEEHVKKKKEEKSSHKKAKNCPECGGKLAFEEGCAKCPSCGYSVCSV